MALMISRITGGFLLMFFGGWSVVLNQKESYKKPKILRKRLSKKEKVMKEHFGYFAAAGALGWITSETYRFFSLAPAAGLVVMVLLCSVNAIALFRRLRASSEIG
ncbi:hypothetical protein JW890_09225 [candidate division WOR-3 bacterium]|nr:hypothetical protein [candidate division WOR-3 bacterium]